MAKFKVGDRVRICAWDDMVQEFKLDSSGDIQIINHTLFFVKGMKPLCCQTATITDVCGRSVALVFDNKSLDSTWHFTEEMLEPIEENKKGERNMFYIKTKIAQGVTVETELPREIFARCPECGAEMKFDILDIRKIAGKAICCDTCERKHGGSNAED